MRKIVVLAGVLVGLAQAAQAADLDPGYLRGPLTYDEAPRVVDWNGFYIGGHVGYANANVDFEKTNEDAGRAFAPWYLSQTILLDATSFHLPDKDKRGAVFGGFVGYNAQWEDAVIGVEANYTHSKLDIESTSLDPRDSGSFVVPIDGVPTAIIIDQPTAKVRIRDYGVLRARAGYAIGHFLPYATVGFAVGRADTWVSARITDEATSASYTAPPVPSKKDDFAYGYAVGGGLDVALVPNVFLRGEYEFVSFDSFSSVAVNIHTVRGALGVKFW